MWSSNLRQQSYRIIALLGLLATVMPHGGAAQTIDTSAFTIDWSQLDQPVRTGAVSRTWMYGPDVTGAFAEAYVDSPGGMRTVQYFDKTRMEITDPSSSWRDPWFVTNGLLATELTTGQLQLGNDRFESKSPAEINLAGDPDGLTGPTYATFAALLDQAPLDDGTTIIQRVTRDGSVINDPKLAPYGVTAGLLVDQTQHRIASPFQAFMWSSGPVLDWDSYETVDRPLFDHPYAVVGMPITEAYWTRVPVGGQDQDVLAQCFERRCLTFTPNNPAGWQVESGSIGQHYYQWRYGDWPQPPGALVYVQSPPFAGQCCLEVAGDLIVLTADGSARHNLTQSADGEAWPAWSPDGTQIAYVNRNAGFDIFVMNADGTNVQPLTDRPGADYAPRWSPDGTRILLTSVTVDGDVSEVVVATVDADGTDYRQLAAGTQPQWSLDGSMIAFVQYGETPSQIMVMRADGTDLRQVSSGSGGYANPVWTPDGEQITFLTHAEGVQYAVRIDGADQRQLWDQPARLAAWAPRGDRVAVFMDGDLFVMNADGSHPINITNGYTYLNEGPVWSPDGNYLAYLSGGWGAIRIASIEHPEWPHRTVAHTTAPEASLDWSASP